MFQPKSPATQAVHELYSAGGAAVEPVGKAFPGCIVDGGIGNTIMLIGLPHATLCNPYFMLLIMQL